MDATSQATLTFGLLALSIMAVWLPPIRLGIRVGASFTLPAWPVLFVAAIASGLNQGYLTWPALPVLAFFAAIAYLASRADASRTQRAIFGLLTAAMALALSMHRLPGFQNPVLIAQARVSVDAVPLTLYANFDKAAVGLILLAWLCRRAATAADWKSVARVTSVTALATAVVLMAAALAVGFVRVDPKWPAYAPLFLAINLLFVCVAEEAFFRGFVQERLAASVRRFRFGGAFAITASALLFGMVHMAAGPLYMGLAALAGLGYAGAYASARRVEAAIITHFVVNLIHFMGFTYPRLA